MEKRPPKIYSSTYYKSLYVARDKSGRSTHAFKMQQKDILDAQRELARKLANAVTENAKPKED